MINHLLHLAWRSMLARRTTAILTMIAVALSVALFAGVEKTRRAAADGFYGAVSGVDLIVGGRTGPVNLLLFSIFRIGDATSPVSYEAYERVAARPEVEWAVPISMGDSHRGYRVVGTTPSYFEHIQFGAEQHLAFAEGEGFDPHRLETVLGASVARDLGYQLGDKLVLAHGLGKGDIMTHDAYKFAVVGILKPTGTPIDQALYVSLEGIERMHAPPGHAEDHDADEAHDHDHAEDAVHDHALEDDHHDHAHAEEPAQAHDAHEDADAHEEHEGHVHLEPGQVTAVLVGVKAPALALRLTYLVNMDKSEPLLAIRPAETLHALWQIVGVAERALTAVSIFVLAVGLATILIAILTSLNERRREMAILRAAGARPHHIFFLIILEAVLLAAIGAFLGLVVIHVGLFFLAPLIQDRFGLALTVLSPRWTDMALLIGTPLAAGIMALWPASRALKNALADGLSIRI